MKRSILGKAWSDVSALSASYLVVPPILEILGSGVGGELLSAGACLVFCAQLAARLGGEEALAGTRDLLRTRAIDPRLHATLRFALGLALLAAFFLWCVLVHALRPDRIFWGTFGIDTAPSQPSSPIGASAQVFGALVLAWAASFAAARECRRAAAVFPAAWGAVAGVILCLAAAWTWKIYLSGPRADPAVVFGMPFAATATAVLLAVAAAVFVLVRRRAGVRS